MSKQVDQRIVEMRFENSTFEKNVSQTMKTLDKLKEKLGFKNAGEGFSNIQKSADKISFEHLIQSVDNLERTVNTRTGIIGGIFEALGNKIVQIFDNTFGKVQQMINQVTFQPIETGFSEYELKIGSVQTIAANTGVLIRDLMGDMMESGEAITATADDLETAWAVMEGVYGNGAERIELLGDSYSVVQDLVNQIVRGEIKMGESIDFATDAAQKQEYTMDDIEHILDDLNAYADQTIYNYGQMTNAIGRFTVAGIDPYEAESNVIGLSNLAAFVGADAEDTARIMRELAQAMNTGYVSLMDWRSLINSSGFSGTIFQDNIESMANHMYASNDAYRAQMQAMHPWLAEVENQNEAISALIDYYGAFKDSLTQGKWFTSDVLTNTLHIFAGNWSDEMYAALGYTEQEIANLQALGDVAFDASTKSKTFTQMWGAVTEAAQSSWTTTWEYIFGHFYDARNFWTIVQDELTDIIDSNNKARNEVLRIWSETGGRDEFFSGIGNIYTFFKNIASSLKDVWVSLFPPITGEMLTDFSIRFNQFTESLERMDSILNIVSSLGTIFFTILKAGTTILGAFVNVLGYALGSEMDSDILGNIEYLVTYIEYLVTSFINLDTIGASAIAFFKTLGIVLLAIPGAILLIATMIDELSKEFLGFNAKDIITNISDWLNKLISEIPELSSKIIETFHNIKDSFTTMDVFYDKIKGLFELAKSSEPVQKVMETTNDIVSKLKENRELGRTITSIAVGLAQLMLVFSGLKAIHNTGNLSYLIGSIPEGISEIIDSVNDAAEDADYLAKAGIISTIASSILMLAVAMGILALIPSDKLKEVAADLIVVMAGVMISMRILSGLLDGLPNFSMIKGATSLLIIAVAISSLVGSLMILNLLNIEDTTKSFIILGGLVVLVAALLDKFNHARFRAGSEKIAIAVTIMVSAVSSLALLVAVMSIFVRLNPNGMMASLGIVLTLITALWAVYVTLMKVPIAAAPTKILAFSLFVSTMIGAVMSLGALLYAMTYLSKSDETGGNIIFAGSIIAQIGIFLGLLTLLFTGLSAIPSNPIKMISMVSSLVILIISLTGFIALLYVMYNITTKIDHDKLTDAFWSLVAIIGMAVVSILALGAIATPSIGAIIAISIAVNIISWSLFTMAETLLILSQLDFDSDKVKVLIGGAVAAFIALGAAIFLISRLASPTGTITKTTNIMFGSTSPIHKFLQGLAFLILSVSISLWLVVDAIDKLMKVTDKFNSDENMSVKMVNMFKGVAKAFADSWSYIRDAIDSSGIGDDLERWFDSFLLHLVNALANLLSALVAIATVLAESIVDIIIGILNGLVGTDLTTWYEAIEGNGVTEEIFESFIKSAEDSPLNKLLNAAVAFITLLVYGIGQALLNMVKPIGAMILEFFATLWTYAIYPDLVALGTTISNGVSVWYNDVASFMWSILLGIVYSIAKGAEWLINTVIINPLNAIISSISSLLGLSEFKAFERVDFTSGLSELMAVVTNQSNEASAAVDNASNSLQNFSDKLDNLSNKNIDSTVTLSPVLNTDQTRLNEALFDAGDTAGKESLKGFNYAWDINSPSKKGEDSGIDIGAGVVNGITGYFNTPEAQEKLTAIKDSLPKIDWNSMYDSGDSEYETNPTKVFNFNTEGLSDNLLQGDFGDEFKGLTDNMGGVSTDLAEVNDYTQKISDALANEGGKFYDDTDVINELTGLRGDISDLSQAIANIKLYLDSNKLVGELVGPLDTALAQRAVYSRRGN